MSALDGPRVGLRRHDEVVPVEPVDLVGPPGHRDSPPLGEEGGMVTLPPRRGPNPIGEGQRGGEVREAEGPLELGDTVTLPQLPGGDLAPELSDLRLGDPRRVAAAGDAGFSGQRAHRAHFPGRVFRSGSRGAPTSPVRAPRRCGHYIPIAASKQIAVIEWPAWHLPALARASSSLAFTIGQPDPNAKTMVATVITTIDRIEAPDPSTRVIHTKKPDPLLPARLAFYGGQIVPKKYVESVGSDTFNAKGPQRNKWTRCYRFADRVGRIV